ncbi:MAG: helix-turn-helix transcriptional regulator, partial [Deltaproteobacteria bacterium]
GYFNFICASIQENRGTSLFRSVPYVPYQPFPMLGSSRGQIWRYAPQYRRPRHFHAEPELNLVVAGTGTFGAGSVVFEAGPGALLCWPPGQDHELIRASPDFHLFVVGLTPELSERVLGSRSRLALTAPTRVQLSPAALGRFRTSCEVPSFCAEPEVRERRVATFWREAHELRLGASDRQRSSRRALTSLLERADLDRDQIASLVRADPSEVSRQFRQRMGLTLTHYRTRLRLLAFIRSVDAGRTLLAAALEAGFGSYSQCHRTFSQTFGCTPRRFFGSSVRAAMRDAFSPLD